MNNQRQSINEYQNGIRSNSQNLNNLANAKSKSSRLYSRTPENSNKLKDTISKLNTSKVPRLKTNNANRLPHSSSIGSGMKSSSNTRNNNGLGNRLKSIIGVNRNPIFQNHLFSQSKDDSAVPDENTGDSVDDTLADESPKQGRKSIETFGTFQIKLKHIKLALIIGAPILGALIIVCLLMSASMVKLDLLGIGSADVSTELEEPEIEESFEEHEKDTDLEIDDDPYSEDGDDSNSSSDVGFYTKTKVKESNLKFIAKRKKRNEARLDELSDYYPAIEKYKDQYDKKMLYNFYYKIHLISKTYKSRYNVDVDVPLLMSTLMMQAKDKDDMNIIFDSNLSYEDNFYEQKSTNEEQNLERFNYDYDWSNYSSSTINSEHDIEVLVQHMFSSQAKETCVNSEGDVTQENILKDEEKEKETLKCEDGEEYKKEFLGMEKDEEKYKEFLQTFLEEKYIKNNFSVTGSGTLGFNQSYTNGTATANSIFVHNSEPDPSMAINYWSYIDSKDFVYPKDDATGKSLGAWPKNYKDIPAQLDNPRTYQKHFIWPVTPTGGTYSYVYEHLGIDIMAKFGTPIYSPVDAILVYSTWGNTVNTGSDETAYSVTLKLEKPVKFAGVSIGHIFMTHMSGIRYRCEWGQCNKKVKKGELLGFVGNAAGSASSGGWAPHLHMTYYPYDNYGGGLYTANMEKLYNIKSGTKRNAGE